MPTMRTQVAIALLFIFCQSFGAALARREILQSDDTATTETTGGTLQGVDASFSNTYAADANNNVEQTVSLFIPNPEGKKPDPEWVRDVIPQRVDLNKPICTLGDREVYPKEKANSAPVTDTEMTKLAMYVPRESDIRPVVNVVWTGNASLVANGKKCRSPRCAPGTVEVTGPGLYGRVTVDAANPEKVICGKWAWSTFGYYEFDIKADGATLDLEYYKRDHTPGRSASFEEFPLTFNLKVHTTVAGNNVNVLTDTALQSKHVDGKIVVKLNNDILGNNNTASQTARARVDGPSGRDQDYVEGR